MSEGVATGAESAIVIDTAGLMRPRAGSVGRTWAIVKQGLVVFVAFVGALAWFGLCVMASAAITENLRGAAEIVVVIVSLVIGAIPFILGIRYLIRFRDRHYSGTGGMISAADFDPAALGRTVPHLGVSLRTLIDRVADFARRLGPVPPRFVETDPAKLRKARNLRWGLVGVAVLGLVLYAATESLPAVLPTFIAAGTYATTLRKARQAVQPTLEQVRSRDPRKPVLLLRSFQDDRIETIHRFHTRIGEIEQTRRFEQQVAGMLEAFGPLVAIGQPGEELPPIGAARAYFSAAEWQPAVVRLIDEATFIAMIAGATEWIRWELGRILEMGRARELLILVPPYPGDWNWQMQYPGSPEERWQNVLDALAGTRWRPVLGTLNVRGLVLVLLRPDGRVLAIRRDGKAVPYADDYQLAIAIALYEQFCRGPG